MNNNGIRWDHNLIYSLIESDSSVLDLGCGSGDLLSRLSAEKNVTGQAVEADPAFVAEAIRNGVAIYQKDLDLGLPEFISKSYDYVVLEKTLQQLRRPLLVLEEILRIGRTCIVSFPNFNYRGVIKGLLQTGKMPVTTSLPYKWYDTPNIHLFTLADFMDWAADNDIIIVEGYAAEGVNTRCLKLPDDYTDAEELLFVMKS
jgi:methionine biosynthesis protein MetW